MEGKRERCFIASKLLNILKSKSYKAISIRGNKVEIVKRENKLKLLINGDLYYEYDLKEEKVLFYKNTSLGREIISIKV